MDIRDFLILGAKYLSALEPYNLLKYPQYAVPGDAAYKFTDGKSSGCSRVTSRGE